MRSSRNDQIVGNSGPRVKANRLPNTGTETLLRCRESTELGRQRSHNDGM